VKPLFDQIFLDIVELTAQSKSGKGSQITAVIDEKQSFGEIVFLGQPMNECSGWISPSPSEDFDIENQL
jgi:co-chaperonin GroES (HSP10)